MIDKETAIQVAVITLDGASCTVPVAELASVIDDGSEYLVRIKTMSTSEFEKMHEFEGF